MRLEVDLDQLAEELAAQLGVGAISMSGSSVIAALDAVVLERAAPPPPRRPAADAA